MVPVCYICPHCFTDVDYPLGKCPQCNTPLEEDVTRWRRIEMWGNGELLLVVYEVREDDLAQEG